MEEAPEKNKPYEVSKLQAVLLLIVLTLLYLMNYADRSILAIALHPMKVALGLSDKEAGLVQSAFSIGVGILTIPGSFLIDRWSRRKTLGIMAILWSIGTWATGVSSTFIQVLSARITVGVGEAAYVAGGTAWLSVVFPKERRSRVLAIFAIGSALGTILGLVLGGYLIKKTGDWRTPFFIFAVPGIILGIMVFFFKDYLTVSYSGEKGVSKKYLAEWLRLFKNKSFMCGLIGQTFYGFSFMTLLGWGPTFLVRGYHMDTLRAGAISAGAAILAACFLPLGGWITDKWQKRNKAGRAYMMATVMFLAFVLTFAMNVAFTGPLWIYIAFLVPQIVVAILDAPLASSMATDIIPVRLRSAGHAIWLFFMYAIGASLGPWVLGAISDAVGGGAHGLRMGAFVILLGFLIAAIVQFINARKYYAAAQVGDEVFAE